MLPDGFIKKEILEDIRNKRAFIIKMILPILLIAPVAFSSLLPAAKSGVLLAFAIFFGVFGSAVAFVRFKESGIIERISVLPIAPWKLTRDYILANAVLDIAQLLVPFFLMLIMTPHDAKSVILSALALAAVILVSNSLGVLVAFVAKSSGEVHLYSIIAILLLVFLSGAISTFHIPVFITWLFPFAAFIHSFTQSNLEHAVFVVISLFISGAIWFAIPLLCAKRSLKKS